MKIDKQAAINERYTQYRTLWNRTFPRPLNENLLWDWAVWAVKNGDDRKVSDAVRSARIQYDREYDSLLLDGKVRRKPWSILLDAALYVYQSVRAEHGQYNPAYSPMFEGCMSLYQWGEFAQRANDNTPLGHILRQWVALFPSEVPVPEKQLEAWLRPFNEEIITKGLIAASNKYYELRGFMSDTYLQDYSAKVMSRMKDEARYAASRKSA